MGAAIIQPIGAIGGVKPHTINVEQENVQLVSSDCIHESRKVYGDCACDKEVEPEPEKSRRKVRMPIPFRVKRKKHEKTTETAFKVLSPESIKKSERKSIFDSLKKG